MNGGALKASLSYAIRIFLALLPLPAFSAPVRVGDFTSPDETIPAPWRIERPNPDAPPTIYRARLWEGVHAVGTWQPNAYTERARMLVLRSGAAFAGRWVEERRDVSADFQAAFGHAPLRLTGIAIATDTDNTGEEARAGFADFHYVATADDCAPV